MTWLDDMLEKGKQEATKAADTWFEDQKKAAVDTIHSWADDLENTAVSSTVPNDAKGAVQNPGVPTEPEKLPPDTKSPQPTNTGLYVGIGLGIVAFFFLMGD